jgi:hypothetical protein
MAEQTTSKPWYKKWWAITLFIFFGLIAIGSLIDNDNSTNQKNDQTISTTENETKNRCENAPEFIVQRLEYGLNTDGVTLRDVKTVKSNDFESVYFISADLQGPGLEGENDIATFSTNKLDSSGLIFSVDNIAEEFFDWPLGSTTDANITMSDDGAQESKDCVNQ